jgi:hypothetical protein
MRCDCQLRDEQNVLAENRSAAGTALVLLLDARLANDLGPARAFRPESSGCLLGRAAVASEDLSFNGTQRKRRSLAL